MILEESIIKPFKFYWRRSFYVHVGIVVIFVILNSFSYFNSKKKKSYNLKLIEASVKVDIVAMPKLTVKELRSMEKQYAKKVEVTVKENKAKSKTIETGKEFIKKKKKKNFMEMLKEQARQKNKARSKARSKTKNKISKQSSERLNKLILAGNKLSKGEAITGTGNSAAQSSFDNYISSFPSIVKPYWRLPSYLMNKNLQCRIRIFLSKSGKLLKVKILQSSGNTEYDAKALEAVRASAPFPMVPESARIKVIAGEIVLGFPL